MSETKTPRSKNPFEGLDAEHLFAADLPEVRYDYELLGQPCFVVLKPMDASAEADFRSNVLAPFISAARDGVAGGFSIDQAHLGLLLGSVVDFQFAREKQIKGSDKKTVELTPCGKDLTSVQRKEIFRSLTKGFRERLVLLACEVNGLDPLSVCCQTSE